MVHEPGGSRIGKGTNGLFVADEATIYLDVRLGKTAAGGRRFTVHHEIFHAIDYRRDRSFEDKAWGAISGENAYYRKAPGPLEGGTTFVVEPSNLGIMERRAGFMTSYSKSEVREDKAELFACMMSLPIFVETRMKDEPQIASKVGRMEAILKEACPTLTAGFWASPSSAD